MTSEEASRLELLARERVLVEQVQFLQEQLRTVRASLAARAAGPVQMASPALPVPVVDGVVDGAAGGVVSAPLIPPAGAAAVAAVPASPSAPPVPDDRRTMKSRKRGWVMARIEQLIAEGGPTFSYHTIFEAYRAKWGWKSYPSEGSIGMTLWKVVRKQGHRIVTKGGGRRSTVYEKVSRG